MKRQGQKLVAAGATMIVAEPVLALAHTGGAGVLVGLAAGAFAYLAADEIHQVKGGGAQEASDTPKKKQPRDPSKPALAYRLLNGKSARGQTEDDTASIEPLQPAQRAFDDDLAAPTLAPSGPFYFSDVLKSFTPTLNRIYLGTMPDGKHLFIPAHELCHTALTGATRGGKDHLIRQLMSQLCKAGAKCYLLDPNYTRYDLESRDPFGRSCPEDWTPFDRYLKNDPRELIPVERKYQVIEHYLKAAYELVNQRMMQRGHAQKLGAPQFLFINEIPAIVDEVPNTATYLKKILREGAKLGVFMVNASQDFQVNTVFKDVGGGIRKCYRTAFDVGSDPATQRALGLPVVNGLGKGKVSLRCEHEQREILATVYVPYVDNEALYQLLGPSTYIPESEMDWQAEDELMSYMVSGQDYEEERYTDPLPVTRQYHGHGASSLQQRRAERVQRLRGTAPVPAPVQETRTIPTIDDVRAAFPNGKPSKRDIQKRFELTDYQAYKLYGQL